MLGHACLFLLRVENVAFTDTRHGNIVELLRLIVLISPAKLLCSFFVAAGMLEAIWSGGETRLGLEARDDVCIAHSVHEALLAGGFSGFG